MPVSWRYFYFTSRQGKIPSFITGNYRPLYAELLNLVIISRFLKMVTGAIMWALYKAGYHYLSFKVKIVAIRSILII
jgi:hypothetical protein